MRAASAAVFGLVWLVLGCGSHLLSEPDPDLPPAEQPDECDLPEPCPGSVDSLDCYGLIYQEHHVCHFEALVGDSPAVIRAASVNFCGDPTYVVEHVVIGRWPDGSMTCALGEVELEQLGMDLGTPTEFDTYACELSDPSMFEVCLADAKAGEPSSSTSFFACMDWKQWGIELGDPVEPVCE